MCASTENTVRSLSFTLGEMGAVRGLGAELRPGLTCLSSSCESRSVVSDSGRPRGLQPSRLLCPSDSAGKNTGVGCHFLLQGSSRFDPWVSCIAGGFFTV